jgi:hypothetical protein
MLLDVVLATLLGAVLLLSAGLKIADRTGTAIAAATYGLRGRLARSVWLPLAAIELALAGGLLAGSRGAAWAAAAVLGAFAVAQAGAVAAGRGGAPCGCFGARGQVSWGSAARAAGLAAAAALLAAAPTSDAPSALHFAAAIAAVLAATILVLRVRSAGVPGGALELDEEGPALGSRLSELDLPPGDIRLAFFSAEGCRLCRALLPQAQRMGAVSFDESADARAWQLADVPGAPFALALGADGTVLAKGTVNTRRQLASVTATARARAGLDAPQPPATSHKRDPQGQLASSRRGFLAAAGGVVAALTVGRTVASFIKPGDADAHHFCGHTFTTDSCPHPTGLPRIDSRGFPLRAQDGAPIDDLGRRINAAGSPIYDNGSPMLDADDRPLPPATRTRICAAAAKRFHISTQIDGSWHRCCEGHVRRLMDCCTTAGHRINGDRALKGYCYHDRHVFCVMYFQTGVPC